MYAQLCRKLCEEVPNLDPPSNSLNNNNANNNTFRRLLLAKCQDEFENRRRASEEFESCNRPLTPEEEEQRSLAKHKMLGNIKFMGELGKQGLLQEAILHQCVQQLLAKKRHVPVRDMAPDLECLCQIMKTVGHRLDNDKAKQLMNQYFDRIQSFANHNELPSRIRFMLQDVMELRANNWVPRRIPNDQGPKTIKQVRDDAARDYGVLYPQNLSMAINLSNLLNPSSKNRRGCLEDVFGSMPLGTLGTGPGVIPADTFPAYSSNMGRPNRSGGGPFSGPGFLNSRPQFYNNSKSNVNLFPPPLPRGSSKEMPSPPRLNKKTGAINPEEISLRPGGGQNLNKTKPNLGLTTESLLNAPNPITSSLQKELNKQEKAKPQKLTKENVTTKATDFLNNFLNQKNVEEAVTAFKDINVPKKFLTHTITLFIKATLSKSECDREHLSTLLSALKTHSLLPSNCVLEAFKASYALVAEMESETPRVKSHIAGLMARAITNQLTTLAELFEPLEGGILYPLFLICLQLLHKSQGVTWLEQSFSNSKLNLLALLPELDRTNERLADILEDRDLSFLFPLLRIQSELWKQIQTDPSPNLLYKWIRDNVDGKQFSTPGFINALVTCLVKHITMESSLGDDVDRSLTPDKTIIEKEKDVLEKFKPIFMAFLHEHSKLQVEALYALQVHCYNFNFPKGMLLRWFMLFYDFEVIEEDAYLKWKEDISDKYPGKGKALFQVNQWLTWLEQAEEEEEEEET